MTNGMFHHRPFQLNLYFHALDWVEHLICKNLVSILHNYDSALFAAQAVQVVMMASNSCKLAAELEGRLRVLQACWVFNNWRVLLKIIGHSEEVYANQFQRLSDSVGDHGLVPRVSGNGMADLNHLSTVMQRMKLYSTFGTSWIVLGALWCKKHWLYLK